MFGLFQGNFQSLGLIEGEEVRGLGGSLLFIPGGLGEKSLGRTIEVYRFRGAFPSSESSGSGVEAGDRIGGGFGRGIIPPSTFLGLGGGVGRRSGLEITPLEDTGLGILAGRRGDLSSVRAPLLSEGDGFGGFLDTRGCTGQHLPTPGGARVVANLVEIRSGFGHHGGR
jgi:hypothetical protein